MLDTGFRDSGLGCPAYAILKLRRAGRILDAGWLDFGFLPAIADSDGGLECGFWMDYELKVERRRELEAERLKQVQGSPFKVREVFLYKILMERSDTINPKSKIWN